MISKLFPFSQLYLIFSELLLDLASQLSLPHLALFSELLANSTRIASKSLLLVVLDLLEHLSFFSKFFLEIVQPFESMISMGAKESTMRTDPLLV